MRYRSHLLAGALCAALLLVCPASWAQIGISIRIAPPPLPVYTQPPLPQAGYLWAPGYWAWADGGYYWVPGTWVQPPQAGLLWTPGYWGWSDGSYFWHEGYWAPQVGFYGGVNYGFGYDGIGFVGGYWSRGAFFYNRAVNRFAAGLRVPHAYSRPVPQHARNRASFNGGRGGIQARASAAQLAAGRGRHFDPIAAQRQQQQAAIRNPQFRAGTNHGRPPIGATARPGQFGNRSTPQNRPNVRIPERANGRAAPAPQPRPAPGPAVQPRVTPRATGPRREATPRQSAPRREASPREAAPSGPSPTRERAAPPAAPRANAIARPSAGPRPGNRAPAHAPGRPPAAHADAGHAGAPAQHRPAPQGDGRQPDRRSHQ